MNPIVSTVSDGMSVETHDIHALAVIDAIRSPRLKEPVECIRQAYWEAVANGRDGKKAIAQLKVTLPAILWSGRFTTRAANVALTGKLTGHSGLLCADLDNLSPEQLACCRAKLAADKHVFALFTSPTGTGLKVVFRVSSDAAEHVNRFRAIQAHVRALCGVEIDEACKDITRLCYSSWDPDAHVNRDAVELSPLESVPPRPTAAAPPADPRRYSSGTLPPSVEQLLASGAEKGQRNSKAFDLSCQFRDARMSQPEAEACILEFAGRCKPPLPEQEARAVLRSAFSKSPREPARKLPEGSQSDGQKGRAPITPAQWFAGKFPLLSAEYGAAILEETDKDGIVSARDIGEDFFAGTLGDKGSPNAPTVFLPTEEKFYTYLPDEGIFIQQRDPVLLARLSRLLLDCARQCRDGCQTKTLEFRFRDSASLSGVLRKARGLLETPHDFFSTDLTESIPCANGMLRLKDKTLLPFNPSYRRRNKLAVPFDPAAKCPLFLDTLMRQALYDSELDLLQRWCGLALIGENLAQRILILTGTAGGGKGTFIRVLNGIIGQTNLASLRPQLLGERFELGRFLGKTLLYGADVPEDFLNQRGASVLKSLTGYDPVTLEFKNSNESPSIICRFNVIVTCNSRLTVHLEGDTDAWRRRLAMIPYHKPKPERVIADLDQQILQKESSGVLNWMLAGLDKIRADDWQLRLTANQQGAVDNLLLESDGHAVFARDCLRRDASQSLTVPDCFAAYVEFCNQRGWTALTKNRFGALIGDEVVRQFSIVLRHDIPDTSGKMQRGWKGLCLAGNSPEPTDKKASETSESQPGVAFSDTTDTFSPVQPEKKLVEEFA